MTRHKGAKENNEKVLEERSKDCDEEIFSSSWTATDDYDGSKDFPAGACEILCRHSK
jgi:hypothetical protein